VKERRLFIFNYTLLSDSALVALNKA